MVAYLENLEGAGKVEAILAQSAREAPSVCMSAVNWGEVYYTTWHDQGREAAGRKAGEISQLPLAIVSADRDQAQLAAQLKAVYRLPYADAFAAALAINRNAKLVTADSDFQVVESKVELMWLIKSRKR